MGQPITGSFARANQGTVPYASALKWGTGYNPIHSQYGESNRPFGPGVPNDLDQRTRPAEAGEDFTEAGAPWGVEPDDIAGLDVFNKPDEATGAGVPYYADDRSDWGQTTTETRADVNPDMSRPWGRRGITSGLHNNKFAGPDPNTPETSGDESAFPNVPTETVSEGWRNKVTSEVAKSEPANNAQLFVQTSQTQRFAQQSNARAQMRGTDAAREPIASRVKAMVEKVYSGGERHYDMFPRQIDDIPRPFRYRIAGTGPNPYLSSNEFFLPTPLQRNPPPDASMGVPADSLGDAYGYGYTGEDGQYY